MKVNKHGAEALQVLCSELKLVITKRQGSAGDNNRSSPPASSPIWASETSLARMRERAAKPLSSAPRSRVLARLASLPQIGELARRLQLKVKTHLVKRCALRKFHVIDGQNTRDQIASDRRSKRE